MSSNVWPQTTPRRVNSRVLEYAKFLREKMEFVFPAERSQASIAAEGGEAKGRFIPRYPNAIESREQGGTRAGEAEEEGHLTRVEKKQR